MNRNIESLQNVSGVDIVLKYLVFIYSLSIWNIMLFNIYVINLYVRFRSYVTLKGACGVLVHT